LACYPCRYHNGAEEKIDEVPVVLRKMLDRANLCQRNAELRSEDIWSTITRGWESEECEDDSKVGSSENSESLPNEEVLPIKNEQDKRDVEVKKASNDALGGTLGLMDAVGIHSAQDDVQKRPMARQRLSQISCRQSSSRKPKERSSQRSSPISRRWKSLRTTRPPFPHHQKSRTGMGSAFCG
jgi:hypothetical protein